MFFEKKLDSAEIVKKINARNILKRYLYLVFGCFLLSIAFNVFFLPENIVYGGVAGISIITNSLLGWDPSLVILIADGILLVISFLLLGWEKTKGSIIGSLLFPIMVKLTANFGSYLQFDITNTLLLVIFGGVVAGIGAGIIFKTGFTTGGTDIVNQIVSKYGKVSIGKAMLMSDVLIALSAGFFLGGEGIIFAWEKVMYAIMVLYLLSSMTDKVILGISQSKCFYIVTTHETAVKKFLIQYLNHGVTVLDGRGGFTGDHKKVIMCIVPTKEYTIVKEAIHDIDSEAFFLVTDAYEVYGGE